MLRCRRAPISLPAAPLPRRGAVEVTVVFGGGVEWEPVDGADHGRDGVTGPAFAAVGEVAADGLPDEIGGGTALGGGDGPQLPVNVFLEVDLCPPHRRSIHHSRWQRIRRLLIRAMAPLMTSWPSLPAE